MSKDEVMRAARISATGAISRPVQGGETVRYYGVYAATVSDIKDPDDRGRVKVRFTWSIDPHRIMHEAWARLATLSAGPNRGTWFIPDVGDEVLVSFEAGDPLQPYVVGSLWNARALPPESMDGAGRNDRKTIRSRNGTKIAFDDHDGQESLTIETPGGCRITLRDGLGSVRIQDSNGNGIELRANGVALTSSSKLSIAAGSIEISAGQLNVNAGTCKFSGTVQSETVVTKSVVSDSYTPGAGNIW